MSAPKIPRSVGVHDGPFHADEVTACALLLLYDRIDRDKILRTRNPDRLVECEYVCDVGGIYDPTRKLFDHHQVDYNGLLSSAGMIWRYFLTEGVINQELYDHLNNSLILGIDAHDNGRIERSVGVTTFSHVIADHMPIDYSASQEDLDRAFDDALTFTCDHLQRVFAHYDYTLSCRTVMAQKMASEQDVLIFDRAMPWVDNFFALGGESHPAKFVIMPSGEHWKLRGIPPNNTERMAVRIAQPKEWAGLLEEELKQVTGIPGAIFCHKGRFISVWRTKEDAIAALQHVLAKVSSGDSI